MFNFFAKPETETHGDIHEQTSREKLQKKILFQIKYMVKDTQNIKKFIPKKCFHSMKKLMGKLTYQIT